MRWKDTLKFSGPAGYTQAFNVVLTLSILAVGFVALLKRQAPTIKDKARNIAKESV